MALFGGPRRQVRDREDRATVWPWPTHNVGTFAEVDPTSGETSLQSVAVRATADLIASLASELPITVNTGDGAERKAVRTPPNLQDPGGDDTGVEDWIYRLLMSWALRGNMYGLATSYDRRGRVTTVDLLHPDDVTVTVVDGKPQWRIDGKDAPDTFVHRRVNPVPGRVLGLSPVELHASTIGVSLSATRFGRQWFTDGAHPGSMLTNTEVAMTEPLARATKQRFVETTRGSREPLVLGKGWEYRQIQLTPEQSQFLGTQGMTEAQCARMFGPGFAEVMGYETGGSMTYQNVVDRRQDLLVLSMNKWLRRVERVLSDLVPPQQYVRLNRDALLEATTLTRYQAHASALGGVPWRTVNEVRAIEDLPPVPWGDEPNGQLPAGGGTGGNPPGA